jgi:hypothetical protein
VFAIGHGRFLPHPFVVKKLYKFAPYEAEDGYSILGRGRIFIRNHLQPRVLSAEVISPPIRPQCVVLRHRGNFTFTFEPYA